MARRPRRRGKKPEQPWKYQHLQIYTWIDLDLGKTCTFSTINVGWGICPCRRYSCMLEDQSFRRRVSKDGRAMGLERSLRPSPSRLLCPWPRPPLLGPPLTLTSPLTVWSNNTQEYLLQGMPPHWMEKKFWGIATQSNTSAEHCLSSNDKLH